MIKYIKKNALHLNVLLIIIYVPVLRPTMYSTNKAQYNHPNIFSTMYSLCIYQTMANSSLNLTKDINVLKTK